MKKLKRSTKILIIVCIAGLSLLLYPSVSDLWNRTHATHAISSYVEQIQSMDPGEILKIREEAERYNRELLKRGQSFALSEELSAEYENVLDPTGNGLMGYLDIVKIGVSLPIYHSVSDRVLQTAVGHIPWSSVPVGGKSTHAVLSGHRGLPTARLFTDLDRLKEGDTFELVILGESMFYEVDQIRTVEPDQVNELRIIEGEDYCTLVTCTPYGINTHRLLVRGHRVDGKSNAKVVSEAVIIDPLIVAPALAGPLLFILFLMIMLKKPEDRRPRRTRNPGNNKR